MRAFEVFSFMSRKQGKAYALKPRSEERTAWFQPWKGVALRMRKRFTSLDFTHRSIDL